MACRYKDTKSAVKMDFLLQRFLRYHLSNFTLEVTQDGNPVIERLRKSAAFLAKESCCRNSQVGIRVVAAPARNSTASTNVNPSLFPEKADSLFPEKNCHENPFARCSRSRLRRRRRRRNCSLSVCRVLTYIGPGAYINYFQ